MSIPLLIAFEGIDGVGKTTQCQILSKWLTQRNVTNIVVKEPGATKLGAALRDLVVNHSSGALSGFTEMLLFEADRSHTYDTLILPSLRSGVSVIKDRSIFGTLAYQGYGKGISLDLIQALTSQANQGRRADWSFLLDLPVQEADRRLLEARGKAGDHFEAASQVFKEKVREAYLSQAHENQSWCSIIDASLNSDEIAATISQKVDELLRA